MNKEELLEKREQFFNDIIFNLNREVAQLDLVFGQDKFYVKPAKNTFVIDVINGELVGEVSGEFFGKKFQFMYSIWQIGTKLKIGFLLKTPELLDAFSRDEKSEVLKIWGEDIPPSIKLINGCAFYDWELNGANIYDSYLIQENYSMGMRHMHMSILQIIYSYAEQQQLNQQYQQDTHSQD